MDEEEETEVRISNAEKYGAHTNSEMLGNPSKHSAFGSATDGISNRELSTKNPVKVIRCTATARSTGKQCGRFSLRGTNVCIKHGGQLPDVQKHAAAVVEAAKLRLIGLSDMAVDVLAELAEAGTAEQIRLKASTEILDRAGVRGGQEIDLAVEVTQVESAADRTRAALEATSRRIAEAQRQAEEKRQAADDGSDIIDAEIVLEDDE